MKLTRLGYITTFLLTALTVNIVNAQEVQIPATDTPEVRATVKDSIDRHEYSLYLKGGSSNPVYTLNSGGTNRGDLGIGVGFAYTYNINTHWGISTGLEFATFSGKASYAMLNDSYIGVDYEYNNSVTYSYSIKDYEERQSFSLLSLPVTMQYKAPISNGVYFYGLGGFKLGMPMSAKATIIPGDVKLTGHFAHENGKYEHIEKPGERTSEIETNMIAVFLSFETGLRFTLGNTALYTGVYFDYAVNDLKQTKNKHPLNVDSSITYESVLNSTFADKLNLMSIGLKIKFSLF